MIILIFNAQKKKLAEKKIFTFSIIYIRVNFERNISELSRTIISVDILTKNVYIEYQALAEDFQVQNQNKLSMKFVVELKTFDKSYLSTVNLS